MSKSGDLTKQIISHIYKVGGYSWRANSVGIFDANKGVYRTAPKKGVADVLGCFKGRFIAVEVKIGRDTLSPEQEGFIANIRHVGGIAFVAKDYDQFLAAWNVATKDMV